MKIIPAIALLAVLSLGGCVPLAIGAGGAAAVGAAQDRGLEQAVDDNQIAFEINRKLLAENATLYRGVSTQVQKGRVLLTGTVPNAEDRVTVTRIVWTVGGVKEVINELRIGEKGGFSQSLNDTTISTRLRARLTAMIKAVRSEKLGEVAEEFDRIHSIQRAVKVGSVDRIIPARDLRPWIVAAIESGMARELERLAGATRLASE